MSQQTSKLKTFLVFFTPSASGVTLYIFLAGAAIILNQFENIKHYLQLPHDLNLLQSITGWADTLLTGTIGETRTDTLVVGLFWAAVGLVVYLFLRTVASLVVELDDDLGVRGYVWPRGTDRYHPLRLLAEQVFFRIVAIIGLIFVVIGPVATILRGPVLVDFLGPNKTLQFFAWFVISVLTWHLVIILVRLMALRARLFG